MTEKKEARPTHLINSLAKEKTSFTWQNIFNS
jgi:hypothetical protein